MHAVNGVRHRFRLRINQMPVEVRHVWRLHLLQIILGARRAQIACFVEE